MINTTIVYFQFTELVKEDLEIEEQRKNRGRISDLFVNRIFLLNLTLISSAWFATGMMFYGLSIYMPEFKDTDVRLVTFLLGLAEIPADIVPIVALNRYKNKQFFCIYQILRVYVHHISEPFFQYRPSK